jgi:tRNA nucleotidyltransferase (CCA-adding enzyme)
MLLSLQGKEVSSLLSKKPGPWTGNVLMQIIKWQLDHPRGTKNECAAWLKEEINIGRLTLDSNRKTGQEQGGDGPCSKKVKLSKDT